MSSHRILWFSLGKKSLCNGFNTRAPTFVGLRMLLRDASRDHVHVSLRLSKRHSGFETADHQQPVDVVVDLVGLE